MDTFLKEQAARALGLLDLTSLNDSDTEETVKDLCAKAHGEFGHTAAVCIWPRFVKTAKEALKGTPVRIATVVNFPHGGTDVEATVAETKQAIADGADEIDVVLPYKAFMEGDAASAKALLVATRKACEGKTLKVIIEAAFWRMPTRSPKPAACRSRAARTSSRRRREKRPFRRRWKPRTSCLKSSENRANPSALKLRGAYARRNRPPTI